MGETAPPVARCLLSQSWLLHGLCCSLYENRLDFSQSPPHHFHTSTLSRLYSQRQSTQR